MTVVLFDIHTRMIIRTVRTMQTIKEILTISELLFSLCLLIFLVKLDQSLVLLPSSRVVRRPVWMQIPLQWLHLEWTLETNELVCSRSWNPSWLSSSNSCRLSTISATGKSLKSKQYSESRDCRRCCVEGLVAHFCLGCPGKDLIPGLMSLILILKMSRSCYCCCCCYE